MSKFINYRLFKGYYLKNRKFISLNYYKAFDSKGELLFVEKLVLK